MCYCDWSHSQSRISLILFLIIIISQTEAYLVEGNGAAAKVKAISIEDYISQGSVKFAGPAYKWTSAKISQTLVDGSKVETEYTFNDADVAVSTKTTTKDGKVAKDSGSLKVVSRPDFESVKSKINSQINISSAQ